MSLWRTILSAFSAVPTLPLHHVIRSANDGRREVSDFAARVHSAAQSSALDVIDRTAAPGSDRINRGVDDMRSLTASVLDRGRRP